MKTKQRVRHPQIASGFQTLAGSVAGHIATFAIFIMLAAILTSQAKTLRFEKSDLQLADA
jgi:hypothetical protein